MKETIKRRFFRAMFLAACVICPGIATSDALPGSEPCGLRVTPEPLETSFPVTGHGGAVDFSVASDRPEAFGIERRSFHSDESNKPRVHRLRDIMLELRILVLTATKNVQQEPALALIKEVLDGYGIPYDVRPLTAAGERAGDSPLELECPPVDGKACGKYYGVVLTSDMVAYQDKGGRWASGLTPGQWEQLAEYEVKFGVRRVAIAAFPRAVYGVNPVGDPVATENKILMLPAAKGFSSGLVTGATLPLTGSFQNPASISDFDLAEPIALFGNPVPGREDKAVAAAITRFPSGREQLNFFFAQSIYLTASRYTSVLWVNWLTHGLYPGKRRMYLNLQVDDVFMGSAMWNMVRLASSEDGYGDYRITPDDIDELVAWQRDFRSQLPAGSTFMIEMAANGTGVWETEDYAVDALFHKMRERLDEFFWVSHTFSHPDLDKIAARRMQDEIRANQFFLHDLLGKDHPKFSPKGLITPHISGLFNRNALLALYQAGILNVVGDNSRRELWPANPYEGYYTASDPNGFDGIFVIPRQATVAPVSSGPMRYLHSFYNNLYKTYWGRELSSSEILQLEAVRVSKLLMAWRHDPYMFHQGNLWVFDWGGEAGVTGRKQQSLLTLWAEYVVAEVNRYMSLPVLSAKMDDMATLLQRRMQLNECKPRVVAEISGGIVRSMDISATGPCQVPVTGVARATLMATGADLPVEVYGPDRTVYVEATAIRRVSIDVVDIQW